MIKAMFKDTITWLELEGKKMIFLGIKGTEFKQLPSLARQRKVNMKDIIKEIELQDCPLCNGPGLIEEEGGWCFYVMCLDCGCHTAEIPYESPAERLTSAKNAAHLWNIGKVLRSDPGE